MDLNLLMEFMPLMKIIKTSKSPLNPPLLKGDFNPPFEKGGAGGDFSLADS
jgi:hypothetical protein